MATYAKLNEQWNIAWARVEAASDRFYGAIDEGRSDIEISVLELELETELQNREAIEDVLFARYRN